MHGQFTTAERTLFLAGWGAAWTQQHFWKHMNVKLSLCTKYSHTGEADTRSGFLNLFCSMDPFEILVKPTDLFSEKCISIHKIEVVRFIEVKKNILGVSEAINCFVAYRHY
jgi:hypothetical protein